MIRLATLASAALFAATMASPGAHASPVNLVANGSFETPNIGKNFYQNFGANTGDPTWVSPGTLSGWSIPTNNVDIVGAAGSGAPAFDGVQYLDLVGMGSTGEISQNLATTAGQTYAFSFAYGNNPWTTQSTASALVTVGDLISTTVTHDTSVAGNIFWTVYSGFFTADSSSTVLDFLNTVGGNNAGVLLDDISVTATPLPSTWTMLLAGFAGLGFAGYYRGRNKGRDEGSAAPATA